MKSKYTIFGILFLFLFIVIAKELEKRRKEKSLEEATKEGCIHATNQLFGKIVDSVKTCDCAVTAFYSFLQPNPEDLEKYKRSGLNGLDRSKRDRFASLYQNCILENIVDTNAKLVFSPQIQEQLRIKLKDTLAVQFGALPEHRINAICNCLAKALNNKITVKQYLTADFSEIGPLYDAMRNCVDSNK